MKIAFLINNIAFGGAEKMATFIANSLADRGHHVSLICLNGKVKTFQTLNPQLHVYKNMHNVNSTLFQYLIWLKHIICSVKKEKADVIISFVTTPNFLNSIINKLIKIPSIISERGNPYESFKEKTLINKIILYMLNQSTGAVFQTQEAALFYSKALQQRSCIIPNPIYINGDIPNINYSQMPHTVVFLGRLDNPQKRLDILLDGFKEFNKTHQDYKLIIYGRGPAQPMIEKFIATNKMYDRIILKGVSKSPLQDLSREGIFVITSDFEGISNSLLEAMAIGMPVISTDHAPGGGRLLIQDHINGLLIPTGDHKALEKALSEFADNIELCRQCGSEAKKVLNRFAPIKIVDLWENYIHQVVKNK